MNEEIKNLIDPFLKHYGFTIEDVVSESRKSPLPDCRFLCIAAVKHVYPYLSLKAIGDMFGGRDHSTVIHAIRKTKEMTESYGAGDLKSLWLSVIINRRKIQLPDEAVFFTSVNFA